MDTSRIDVSVSEARLGGGTRGFGIKIQADLFELNISMTTEEMQMLPRVRNARWDDRASLQLGETTGSPAWWSCDERYVSILVGEDDECWDFGVKLPVRVVGDILADFEDQGLAAEQAAAPGSQAAGDP